jgi:predicted ATPase
MSVIGITGVQGAGKTSILTELQARGYNVDQFKVSRAVQQELGWGELNTVMNSFDTMVDFQQRVLNAKIKNDSELLARGGLFLTERTFADIYGYTALWTYKLIDSDKLEPVDALKFLAKFLNSCLEAQHSIYAGVIYVPMMPHIVFAADPHRASEADIDDFWGHVMQFALFEGRKFGPRQELSISAESVQDRATQVELFLKGF